MLIHLFVAIIKSEYSELYGSYVRAESWTGTCPYRRKPSRDEATSDRKLPWSDESFMAMDRAVALLLLLEIVVVEEEEDELAAPKRLDIMVIQLLFARSSIN